MSSNLPGGGSYGANLAKRTDYLKKGGGGGGGGSSGGMGWLGWAMVAALVIAAVRILSES